MVKTGLSSKNYYKDELNVIFDKDPLFLYNLFTLDNKFRSRLFNASNKEEYYEETIKLKSKIKKCKRYKIFLEYTVLIYEFDINKKYKTLISLIERYKDTFELTEKTIKGGGDHIPWIIHDDISLNSLKGFMTLDYLFDLFVREKTRWNLSRQRPSIPIMSLMSTLILDKWL